MKQASGFYADSLEMLLDTMCNVLGGVIFITLAMAVLVRNSSSQSSQAHQREVAQLTNQIAAVTASNALAEAQLQSALLKIQEPAQPAATNHMRLPNISHTTKQPWTVIVRYGKAYPLYWFGVDRAARPVLNTRSIQCGSGSDTMALEPDAEKGEDPELAVAQIIESFKRNSKTNFYLEFWVYQDSFGAFDRARETAARMGFQFGWEPLPANQRLKLSRQGEHVQPQN